MSLKSNVIAFLKRLANGDVKDSNDEDGKLAGQILAMYSDGENLAPFVVEKLDLYFKSIPSYNSV